jgi:hypothetical protein
VTTRQQIREEIKHVLRKIILSRRRDTHIPRVGALLVFFELTSRKEIEALETLGVEEFVAFASDSGCKVGALP